MKTLLYSKIVIYLPAIISFILVSSVYAATDSMYWGAWETKKDTEINVKIEIKRKKRTKVIINGKVKPMQYNDQVLTRLDPGSFSLGQKNSARNRIKAST